MEIVEKPNNPKFQDLTNRKFGRLTVLYFAGRGNKEKKRSYWWCICSCVNKKIVKVSAEILKRGSSKSCGCLNSELVSARFKKHDLTKSKEYKAYQAAKDRCINLNKQDYKEYGDRGIEFRFNSFEEFYDEIGKATSIHHSLDRINNDGHYEVGNIKWATDKQQSRNRRSNRYYKINGERKCLTDWAEILDIKATTIAYRLDKLKWCENCAFTIKRHKGKCCHR